MPYFEHISMLYLILLLVAGKAHDRCSSTIVHVFVLFSCHCNGHANKCTKTAGIHKNETQCECEHNTIGRDCDTCHAAYNDAPWKAAGVLEAHACKGKTQI
jgi:hypothetical protein